MEGIWRNVLQSLWHIASTKASRHSIIFETQAICICAFHGVQVGAKEISYGSHLTFISRLQDVITLDPKSMTSRVERQQIKTNIEKSGVGKSEWTLSMVELAQKQRVLLKPERVRIRHVKHQHINAHDNTNWQRQQGKKNRRMKKTKLKATKASSRSSTSPIMPRMHFYMS